MGLVIGLLALSIALVIVGIAVKGILWLAVIGFLLLVASVVTAAVRSPS
jgi:hypothetical protein